jgi:hypothetical protein
MFLFVTSGGIVDIWQEQKISLPIKGTVFKSTGTVGFFAVQQRGWCNLCTP